MPIISAFFGIVVRMYFDDHAPPHFHAEYQGQEAMLALDGSIIQGEIRSATARRLLREWGEAAAFRTGGELAARQEIAAARTYRSLGVTR